MALSSHDLNSRDAFVDGGIILSADLGEGQFCVVLMIINIILKSLI